MYESLFVDKLVEKYNLHNIMQKELSYGFFFDFQLVVKKYEILTEDEQNLYSSMSYEHVLKIINMVLEILGFKAQVKDYMIFFNYKNKIMDYKKENFYIEEGKLIICFKKEEVINKELEEKYVFKMSEVGKRINTILVLFYIFIEDFFIYIGSDKNYDFLGNKMSDEEMYKYLFNIYKTLKENYYDKNKYFCSRLGSEELEYFKYDDTIPEESGPYEEYDVIGYNTLFYERIGYLFVHDLLSLAKCLPIKLIPNFRIYQYGVMKGYGKYNYLELVVHRPHITMDGYFLNDNPLSDIYEENGLIKK